MVFGLVLVMFISPFYLMWLPIDLLIGYLRKPKTPTIPASRGIIALDIETTGLDPERDEILSIAIVDAELNVLMNTLVRPACHMSWDEAQGVNGITPQMVSGRSPFHELRPMVQETINNCQAVLMYNERFDRAFLENAGIRFTSPVIDVMIEYSRKYRRRWTKLVDAAGSLGISLAFAHDALADATATMQVYQAMLR